MLVVVIGVVVAADAGGGLPSSLLVIVVVVVRWQLMSVTAARFDGSSIAAGLFWCSDVGVGGSSFHIEVIGNSNRGLRSQQGRI